MPKQREPRIGSAPPIDLSELDQRIETVERFSRLDKTGSIVIERRWRPSARAVEQLKWGNADKLSASRCP